jgi:hypothetical protein
MAKSPDNEMKYYVGYCSTSPATSAVCYSSMSRWVSKDKIELLKLKELQDYYQRPRDPKQSTEFSFTRFLVPFLNNYRGWALFCDGDFLWVKDPTSISKYCDDRYAVMCVQHELDPGSLALTKMDGKSQTWYRRKNWSSLMLYNCEHPHSKRLTPEVVNNSSAAYLHELDWAENSIGYLPVEYNFLVGYYKKKLDDVVAYHYTNGVPLYREYANCEYSDLWINEYKRIV